MIENNNNNNNNSSNNNNETLFDIALAAEAPQKIFKIDPITPLEKLRRNLSNLQSQIQQCNKSADALNEKRAQKVVLLETGSLSPVHLEHVRMLELAKQHLESLFFEEPAEEISQQRFVVVGAYLSPSCDQYVMRKLGRSRPGFLSAAHRLAMCRLAVSHSSWIDVDSWEAAQDHFVDFPQVAIRLAEFLKTSFPEEQQKIKVVFVCGSGKKNQQEIVAKEGSGINIWPLVFLLLLLHINRFGSADRNASPQLHGTDRSVLYPKAQIFP